MMPTGNDLEISRLIAAPPKRVWEAWSRPQHLARWWTPAPIECRVVKLDLRPGGGFETRMREGAGDFRPHIEACFLEIVPERRLVWTTSLLEGWRPVEPWLAVTAIIDLVPEPGSTLYRARVLHRSPEDARRHADMGFMKGWGSVLDQLAAMLEA